MQSDVIETKETEIGDIPQEWGITKIIDVCETTAGGTPSRKKPEYFKGEIPWFKSGELNDGLIDYSEEKISELAIDESSAKLFPKGTLLIAMYGATAGKTAKLGIDAATNQAICAIFPEEEKLNNDFLQYNLIHSRNELLKNKHGGAQSNLNQGMIKNHLIPLPPFSEQQKIASILSTVQDAIEHTEAVIQATRELKKSMMKHLFSYGPVSVDQTDRVELKETEVGLKPKSWEVKSLADLSTINYGKSNTKEEGKYQVVGSGGAYSTSNKSLTNGETIVVGRKGSAGSVYYYSDPIYPSDTTFYLVFKNEEKINVKFIYYYMLVNKLSGEHAKTTLPSIQKHDLETFLVPLPKVSLQNSIVHIIDTIESKILQETDKKKSLVLLFGSLLDSLMTAKIRVV